MLHTAVQQLGDASVLRCRGSIVAGEAYAILRATVVSQRHTRLVVLDLAEVDRIDAGGLDVLLDLREWARANAIRFKLMNVIYCVEQILEQAALDRVFEFCSAAESLCLMHRAALTHRWPFEQLKPAYANRSRKFVVKAQRPLHSSRTKPRR